jgi:hypothetical protein
MRGEPSPNLVRLLARLKLATAEQLAGVAPRVRRLAGDLPDFESVWVDALAQVRVLTPWQAAEINAGRGDALRYGPYVVERVLAGPHYAACFAARHLDTGRAMRLYVVDRPQVAGTARAMGQLIEQLTPLRGPAAGVVDDAGISGQGIWAACPRVDGTTAAEWMVENGRFSPPVVLQIAREMLVHLADLERLGVVHGDIGAAGLLLQNSGQVVLPMAGLRGIVRPHEGYSFGDLQPEAYDTLAPERIAEGTGPTLSSDLYACGCLWWHLLTGRAPFAGGNSLAKLKAVHAAKLVDVRQLAPEVSEILATAIEMCLAREPEERPQSIAQVAHHLGPPTRSGSALLARMLRRQAPLWHSAGQSSAPRRTILARGSLAAGATVAAVSIAVGLGLFWRHAPRQTASPSRATALVSADHASKGLAPANLTRQPTTSDPATSGESQGGEAAIRLTAATEPAATPTSEDLILPADNGVGVNRLDLKPGRRVRGEPGQRPLLRVQGQGLAVACEDVCFEGIDFVWEPEETDDDDRPEAMLIVAAPTIEFRGCSFSTLADRPPIAVVWRGAGDVLPATAGELTFSDCVLSGTAAVVDCRAATGLTVKMSNSLCVASGPIVRLPGALPADQTLTMLLDHVTTRGDSAVLECRYRRIEGTPGEITITATDSALDTNPGGGLLIFSAAQRPDALVAVIRWNGEGSLVTPHTAVALWRSGAKKQQVLPEDALDVAGLVRSEVEFAGQAEGPPAASRVTRWQVPLRSADPPGANPNTLALPRP